MSSAIKVQDLSKKYIIGHQGRDAYDTLRDAITTGARNLGTRALAMFTEKKARNRRSYTEEFWALKDIEFNIEPGDSIGVIGRNGAGKSTLLKVLSRITAPTTGKVIINGRVASLLEVGTGFHPELTGRENIFLNGAILGMSKTEIKSRFDEIVDFADVERFLDTPVKRYSSGMYVRLAFAVAAHLEPEILIVDEVLAVGDAAFQKKCLGKMEDVGKEGRTILFVSHNMASIQHLCNSCIFLDKGKIKGIGSTREVVDEYLTSDLSIASQIKLHSRVDRTGTGNIVFQAVTLMNEHGDNVLLFRCGETAIFRIDVVSQYESTKENIVIGIGIDNSAGERIALITNENCGQSIKINPGESSISVSVPKLPLLPGKYYFTMFMSAHGEIVDWIQRAGVFTVDEADFYGAGTLVKRQGYFLLEYEYGYL